jgi:hypothetical protein
VSQPGGFADQRRDGAHVVKRITVRDPASCSVIAAALADGPAAAERYLCTLRTAGVAVAPGMAVLPDEPLGVRHRWVTGPMLPDAAATPQVFVSAVREIGRWVRDLDGADARIDTNLANFCLVEDRPVLVDVLPPLIPSRRPRPSDQFDALFHTLCFDTDVILAALVGYAARALLRAGVTEDTARFLAVGHELSPPGTHRLGGAMLEVWFHARAAVVLRALAGDIPAGAAHAFLALTSVRAFRDLGEWERTRRLAQVAAALHGFGLR